MADISINSCIVTNVDNAGDGFLSIGAGSSPVTIDAQEGGPVKGYQRLDREWRIESDTTASPAPHTAHQAAGEVSAP